MKINLQRSAALIFALASSATLASASGLSFTCDPSVAAATCNYLNTTIASQYTSTFTNLNADIYITYGTTGLGESNQAFDVETYSAYAAALAANSDKDALQVSALAAMSSYDATPYGSGDVNLTAALETALGLSGATGVTASGSICAIGTAGCYDGDITITNDPGTALYYDNLGGTEAADAYDFYSVVEHETDEVLGTASCIGTAGAGLTDRCDGFGDGTPSAVDLFRYSAPGSLVLDSSLSTTPGAYFSYNGGATNGATGDGGDPKFYNTLANGDDYADFVSSSPDCGTNQAVQDAEGCPGEDKGLDILDDGGAEINILNAVGYDLESPATVTPEPDTFVLLLSGLASLVALKRRRRS